jgi:NAD(P)-dependent dehydrogenase (short-subunit alcohol dehydrogenase family)
MKLAGKTAIVTGAGTGLGLAIAKRYAAEGANLVIADIKGHEEVAADLTKGGYRAMAITTDVSSEENVGKTVAATIAQFGGVDILVNNAAIASTLKLTPFEELTVAEWRRILDVNTVGVFIFCRAVAKHMRAKKFGRIINVTSGTAFKGAPFMLHYIASKGAVMSMTKSLAREFGNDFVTVNAISPGYTLTEGNLANTAFLETYRKAAISTRSLPRDALPEDLVGSAVFLASEDSAFITGQILAVDGGSVYH